MPRALLISLRDPHDRMALHERTCFAETTGLAEDDLQMHFMMQGHPDFATLRDHDVIFLGGSGEYSVLDDIPWIRWSLEVLLEIVALQLPAWGSCFAFQGLAVAMGGKVIRDDEHTEMGGTELTLTEAGRRDPLFADVPSPFWAQEGHHDRVIELPPGVTLLARGEVCEEQCFKVDTAPFWASQFHPELDKERTIERFLHYKEHYMEPGQGDAILADLQSRPAGGGEIGSVLRRLVSGRF